MSKQLETRTVKGYREYRDPETGEWIPVHRRVVEKKFGGLRPGFHVHHRDHDKANNQRSNLVELHPKIHARAHSNPDICYRCGRDGHWSSNCFAKTFWDGAELVE